MPSGGDTKCKNGVKYIWHIDTTDATKGSWFNTGQPCVKGGEKASDKLAKRALKHEKWKKKKKGQGIQIQSELFK